MTRFLMIIALAFAGSSTALGQAPAPESAISDARCAELLVQRPGSAQNEVEDLLRCQLKFHGGWKFDTAAPSPGTHIHSDQVAVEVCNRGALVLELRSVASDKEPTKVPVNGCGAILCQSGCTVSSDGDQPFRWRFIGASY